MPRGAEPAGGPQGRRARWVRLAPLVPWLVLLLALAVRLPRLYAIPMYGEANENYLAIAILNGKLPLVNQNPHIGALSPYLRASDKVRQPRTRGSVCPRG